MKALIKNLLVEESGKNLIEYALLAGFISLIAVGVGVRSTRTSRPSIRWLRSTLGWGAHRPTHTFSGYYQLSKGLPLQPWRIGQDPSTWKS